MHEKISALLNQFIEWRTRHITNKQFTLILSLAVGFLAAVAASILHTLIKQIQHLLTVDKVFCTAQRDKGNCPIHSIITLSIKFVQRMFYLLPGVAAPKQRVRDLFDLRPVAGITQP